MTGKGLRLGTLAGIPIRIDWSVLAIFALVAWSLSASVYPELARGYRPVEYWFAGVATTVLFFGSLLAHELSHCVAARRVGVSVRDITLWLFGGVSTIEGEAHMPRDEMKIAIAGPATSFAISLGSLAVASIAATLHLPAILTTSALWLAAINLILGVFNLIPAAPLDGGRVLHAWLWHRNGDRTRSGITASRAGQVFAWILITVGIVEFWSFDGVGGIWLMLLGWFVMTAARAEESQARMSRDLRGVLVHEVMTTSPITINDEATIAAVLDDSVLRQCSAFPVVAGDGSLRGLLTLRQIRTVPLTRRASTTVAEVAWPLHEITTAAPNEPVLDVLQRLDDAGDGRVLVVTEAGLVGIVSPTDISRAVQMAELDHAH